MVAPAAECRICRAWPWIAAACASAATAAFPFIAGAVNRSLLLDHPQNLEAQAAPSLEAALRAAESAPRDPFVLSAAASTAFGANRLDDARELSMHAAEAFVRTGNMRWPELFADDIRARVADNAALLGLVELRTGNIDDAVAWHQLAAAIDPVPSRSMLHAITDETLAKASLPTRISAMRMRGGDPPPYPSECVPFEGEDRYSMQAAMIDAGFVLAAAQETDGSSEGIVASGEGATLYTNRAAFAMRYGPASAARGRDRVLMLCAGKASGVGPLVRIESSLGWSVLLYMPDLDWFPVPLPPRGTEASETISVHFLNPGLSTAWRLPEEDGTPWYADNRHVAIAGVWYCGADGGTP